MEKKNILVIIVLVVIVLGVIFLINNSGNSGQDILVIKCIANKSVVFVSKTCSACAAQEAILGENFKYFNSIDIAENSDAVKEYEITRVPTWIINGVKYERVQSFEELKELTGCYG